MADTWTNQIALIAITNEAAEAMQLASLVMVAVQLEPEYVPALVPITLPPYTFSGKGFYISK